MTDLINKIRGIKQNNENSWLSINGVVAVGIGQIAEDNIGLIVSVKENASKIRTQIPYEIDGISIEIQETGEIKAL